MTPEQKSRLEEMARGGFTYADIALRLGVTKNAVIGHAHRAGLAKRRDGTSRADQSNAWRPDEEAALIAWREAGLPDDGIGDLLGRSRGAVKDRATKLGIANRPGTWRPLTPEQRREGMRP